MDPIQGLNNKIDKLKDKLKDKADEKELEGLKHMIYETIVGDEIFEIPNEGFEDLKKKHLKDEKDENIKKFKRKYEIFEEQLEKLNKREITVEPTDLIPKYEISNKEFMEFKKNKKMTEIEAAAFKQMYGKVENPEFKKLERKNEIKKLDKALKDWKKIKYKAYKRAIICLIISSVAFVISIFLLISYNSVVKSGITDIITAIYGVGSFSTLVSNLVTLRSLYVEKKSDKSDDKEEEMEISDNVIQNSLKNNPGSLYRKIDFVEAIQANVHSLLTFQTILSIIMSVILFITSIITILFWFYGSDHFLTANFVLIGLSIIGVYESTGFVVYISLIIQSQVARVKKKLIKKYRKKKYMDKNKDAKEQEDRNKDAEKESWCSNLFPCFRKKDKGKFERSDRVSDFELTTAIMSSAGLDEYENDPSIYIDNFRDIKNEIQEKDVYFCETISLKHFYPSMEKNIAEQIELFIFMIFFPVGFFFGIIFYNEHKRRCEVKRIDIDDIEMYIIDNNIMGGQIYDPAMPLLIHNNTV
ncbi:hypothetical protein C2G38_2055820 [Gigaspora rosea]|uniref:Uncharacterized protein n=1 Tax=Gigaspora rosea TaxID=44941 RepID=A0A397W4Y7_9GLOM|nr:hypothetical protein C2G38_2055820 [Gigaspora rosea]CAG8708020.1 8574_t:CDS:1 [Gigaspora rosea]